MATRPVQARGEGRNETPLERADRNLVELLQELRVAQTGVQVLFAFLLVAPLNARFPELSGFQRATYFATLLTTGLAAVLLMAPTAYHRILFRCGDKEHLVTVASRFMLGGLVCVAASTLGALLFVTDLLFSAPVVIATVTLTAAAFAWCWGIAPLRRRQALQRDAGDVELVHGSPVDEERLCGESEGPALVVEHRGRQSGALRLGPRDRVE
jgi:hypothetical protein